MVACPAAIWKSNKLSEVHDEVVRMKYHEEILNICLLTSVEYRDVSLKVMTEGTYFRADGNCNFCVP